MKRLPTLRVTLATKPAWVAGPFGWTIGLEPLRYVVPSSPVYLVSGYVVAGYFGAA